MMHRSTIASGLAIAAVAVFSTSPLHGQDPIDLLREVRGTTPEAYLQLSIEAERLWQREDTVAIATAYARLTDAYPWNGEHWWRLGIARYLLGQDRAAATAFRQADTHGITPYPQWNAVYAARAWARANEPDSAYVWLVKAVRDYRYEELPTLQTDEAFTAFHGDARFREILRLDKEGVDSRVEGWRTDLDHLLSEIRRANPIYSRQPLPDTLIRAADRLRERIPSLSDAQIAVGLQHLLTLLGHNHNGLYFFFSPDYVGKLTFTHLPLRFYVFPDGVYVIDADAPYEDLIGARVLRFDESTTGEALRAVRYIKDRENEMEIVGWAPEYLVIPQVLHALGLTQNPDRVSLAVLDRIGQTRVVAPKPVAQRPRRKLEASRLAGTDPPPLYLSRPDDQFWFTQLEGGETLFMQLNQIRDKPDETLADFGLRVRRFLAEHPEVRNLVVDVRRNNGGDTYLYPELLQTLAAFEAQEGNRLFVLIGRFTFSATTNFITDLDRVTSAIFVGELSAGKPLTRGGDPADVVLPYSGLRGGVTTTTWQLTAPRDTRLWIAPDLPVVLTAEDYFANRDPVLEAVLNVIRTRGT